MTNFNNTIPGQDKDLAEASQNQQMIDANNSSNNTTNNDPVAGVINQRVQNLASLRPPSGNAPSTQPQPTTTNNQPQSQPHHIFRSIMETLAGPQYKYQVDPNTGTMERIPVKATGTQLANSIVAGALTGLFAGAKEHGPNGVLQSASAGFDAVNKQQQQKDQQDQQRAGDDFARHASIFETNLRLHQNAMQMGQMDYQMHKQIVDDGSAIYDQLKDIPGAIVAENVPEQELSKYHATRQTAIPIGTVPRLKPDGSQATNEFGQPLWDNTYAVINPVPMEIPDEIKQKAVKWGLPGFVNSEGKEIALPKDTRLRAQLVISTMAKVHALEMAQSNLDQFSKAVNAPSDVKGKTKSANVTLNNSNIENIADSAADKYGVDRNLVRAVIKQESNANPKAKSPKGAQGLMQLMPDTAKLLNVSDPYDPAQNVDGGVRYLKQLLDKYDGDKSKALAEYNSGLDSSKGVPNIKETKDYVSNIMDSLATPISKSQDENSNEVHGVNLQQEIANDPTLIKALQQFQRFSGMPIDKALDAMAKDKQAAPYAGKIANLYGGQATIDKYTQDRETKLAASKAAAEAEARLPAEEAKEQYRLNQEQALQKEQESYLQVPEKFVYDPSVRTAKSPQELKSKLESQGVKVPSNLGALFAVANNRANLKTLPQKVYKGTGEMDAQNGLSFIQNFLNPNFNEADFAAGQTFKQDLAKSVPNSAGGTLLSAGVASNHLEMLAEAGKALDNGNTLLANKFLNEAGYQLGKSEKLNYEAIAQRVNQEVDKVVSGGNPLLANIKEGRQNLPSDASPGQIQQVIDSYIKLMGARVYELGNKYQGYFGETRDMRKNISPVTAKVLGAHGLDVPGYGKPVLVNNQVTGFTEDGKTYSFKY